MVKHPNPHRGPIPTCKPNLPLTVTLPLTLALPLPYPYNPKDEPGHDDLLDEHS